MPRRFEGAAGKPEKAARTVCREEAAASNERYAGVGCFTMLRGSRKKRQRPSVSGKCLMQGGRGCWAFPIPVWPRRKTAKALREPDAAEKAGWTTDVYRNNAYARPRLASPSFWAIGTAQEPYLWPVWERATETERKEGYQWQIQFRNLKIMWVC